MMDDEFDKKIRDVIRNMERVHPGNLPTQEALWTSFQAKRSKRKFFINIWRVAAALMILAVAATLLLIPRTPPDAIESSGHVILLSEKQQRAMDFISLHCAAQSTLCASPVVRELRRDLEHSFSKLKEIDQQILIYGDDAELIRARTRIESHQNRIIKTIVQSL